MLDVLNSRQILSFINDGFVRIDGAFPSALAKEVRSILWNDLPCNPNDRATWKHPVVRLGMYNQPPFVEAANTPVLHCAFNQLVGKCNWLPCASMGSFPIRFPSTGDPGDTGWHVDASFPGDDPHDYFTSRINNVSKGRALLMLFLFSDVTDLDAPTKILNGSHIDVARLLQPHGDTGLSFMELANKLTELPPHTEVLATGTAGTVYLCHPFIVHAAQQHQGKDPKFMAQPPLFPKTELNIAGNGPFNPIEKAIRMAIGLT